MPTTIPVANWLWPNDFPAVYGRIGAGSPSLKKSDKVLEIGGGSGYQAALLGALSSSVYSVEIIPELAEASRLVLERLGCTNVTVITGDGSQGLPEYGPMTRSLSRRPPPRSPKVF